MAKIHRDELRLAGRRSAVDGKSSNLARRGVHL
jgi:hypothetical protein